MSELEIIKNFAIKHNPKRTEIKFLRIFNGKNVYIARPPLSNKKSFCGSPDFYSFDKSGKPYHLSFDEELALYKEL